MSYLQVDEYIAPMLSSGLLRYDEERRAYRLTAKGLDFLSSIRQIDYFINTIEE
jgi:predicted transcriptional regulator